MGLIKIYIGKTLYIRRPVDGSIKAAIIATLVDAKLTARDLKKPIEITFEKD